MNKIINFTPTGTQTNRENSFAPLTPNEIIEEVHNAYELGITVTHIHARDPKDLSNTYKKEVYGEIITGIRKHCPAYLIVYGRKSHIPQMIMFFGIRYMNSTEKNARYGINQYRFIIK